LALKMELREEASATRQSLRECTPTPKVAEQQRRKRGERVVGGNYITILGSRPVKEELVYNLVADSETISYTDLSHG